MLVHETGVVHSAEERDLAQDLSGRDLIRALAILCKRLQADDVVAWRDRRQTAPLQTILSDPDAWVQRLRPAHGGHPFEIRHLGFTSTPPSVLRALQAVAGEDPLVVPSGPRRVTWLMGAAAGMATVSTLRRAGFGPNDHELAEDEHLAGIAARMATLGLRGVAQGVLPRHDQALGAAQAIDAWSPTDLDMLIDHRWGATRRGPIRLARLLAPWRRTREDATVAIAPPEPNEARFDPAGDDRRSIDVVIPTLERPGPLADVLADLAAQDVVPRQVLVIEQRPDGSASALDHLRQAAWPFTLDIETIRKLGASQARNRALRKVRARWTALLDDDVRLAPDLLAATVEEAERWGADVLSLGEVDAESDPVVQASEHAASTTAPPPRPVPGMGSGRSLVRTRALVAVGGFDEQIEGWGEDMELGLRMHHAGYTVLASQHLRLVHLNAPRGGFRAPRPATSRRCTPPLPSPLIVYRWLRWMPPSMLAGAVRAHLVRAARHRRLHLLTLPWLWLRYRSALRIARAKLAQGPRGLPPDPNTADRSTP